MKINLKCAAGCFFRLRHAQFEAGHGLVMLNRSLVRVLTRLGFEPTPVFLHLLKELYKDALSTGLPQPQQGIVNLIFCRTEPLHIQILILYLPLSWHLCIRAQSLTYLLIQASCYAPASVSFIFVFFTSRWVKNLCVLDHFFYLLFYFGSTTDSSGSTSGHPRPPKRPILRIPCLVRIIRDDLPSSYIRSDWKTILCQVTTFVTLPFSWFEIVSKLCFRRNRFEPKIVFQLKNLWTKKLFSNLDWIDWFWFSAIPLMVTVLFETTRFITIVLFTLNIIVIISQYHYYHEMFFAHYVHIKLILP